MAMISCVMELVSVRVGVWAWLSVPLVNDRTRTANAWAAHRFNRPTITQPTV
jgi:hypothetical protein